MKLGNEAKKILRHKGEGFLYLHLKKSEFRYNERNKLYKKMVKIIKLF